MPDMLDPYTHTTMGINNIVKNAQHALKKNDQLDAEIKIKGEDILSTLNSDFHAYLEAIRGHKDFPVFTEDKKKSLSEDFRILLFYRLADNIRKGIFALPLELKKKPLQFQPAGLAGFSGISGLF